MSRSINELKSDDKVTIALACLHLELSGDADASKTVAKDFDVSPRGVTLLRNQALEALKTYFSDATPPTTSTSGVATQELKARLGKVLGLDKVSRPSIESTESTESSSEPKETEKVQPLDLDPVFAAIEKYNALEDRKFAIFVGTKILIRISNQPQNIVETWKKENDDKIKTLHEKFNLNFRTNVAIPDDVNLREEIGL